ncbi:MULTISPECIES: hypothetical protein [Bacillus cereus group]|uniref:Uncharacterized protein n=1 Tax=Bacillus thuringiensis subsp. jegathesan TaxID=56955 RepID=A0A9X6MDM4_BACTJ|nr:MULTISPECIES: hypothetical protein [Bacillus cereus group]EHL75788.1 hypothetical protein HMPREF1014_01382 [Bacillus sp. 7_6_55CFAA_CT2]EJR84615.1 hypothetical protein IK9_01365 [Bacillus cereus VD166]MBG9519547.1 hypothetical protein [Bacillus thuringiensis]MCU5041374.1 hypothetical protein [Bacillus cereus]OJE00204.1 hypothetical protein A9487_21145 [Bacillus cereus]
MAILNSLKKLAELGVLNTKIGSTMAVNGVKSAPKKIIKSTFIDTKNKEKSWRNLYTGKKLNPKHVLVAGGGYLAFKQAKFGYEYQMEPLKRATLNNYQYIGPPEIMMYDGVGQERVPKNLNVDGSIVFDLHNNRRG